MIMFLANGGCTTDFECQFKDTEMEITNEKEEYFLSEDDVSDQLRVCANLQYQAEYEIDTSADNLIIVLVIENGNTYIEVRNKNNGTFIRRRAKLNEAEKRILPKNFFEKISKKGLTY